jgi:hypothetical protein
MFFFLSLKSSLTLGYTSSDSQQAHTLGLVT